MMPQLVYSVLGMSRQLLGENPSVLRKHQSEAELGCLGCSMPNRCWFYCSGYLFNACSVSLSCCNHATATNICTFERQRFSTCRLMVGPVAMISLLVHDGLEGGVET